MTPRFSGSSVFTNILAILPILFLTLNQFIWKTSVATVATLTETSIIGQDGQEDSFMVKKLPLLW